MLSFNIKTYVKNYVFTKYLSRPLQRIKAFDALLINNLNQSINISQLSISYNIHIYILCLSGVCLFVYLYPRNVKTAEPIGPKFGLAPYITQGKVYECSKLQKVVNKSFNFVKLWKSTKKIANSKKKNFIVKKMLKDWAIIKGQNRRRVQSVLIA